MRDAGRIQSTAEDTEVNVPATLHATIAARIDRLDPKAKQHAERGGGDRLAFVSTC